MTTALTLIEDALGLIEAVGVDQNLSADEADDALRVLNDLIDEWSTQSLAIYGQANQTFNTTSGLGVYTIGPSGTWNTVRPIRINDPAYSVINGTTFPCISMTQAEYNLIPVKAQTQDYPDRYLYVNENPLGRITLWPVPSAITPVTFSIDRVLISVATIATDIIFPPGYLKAFKYALATELASPFGRKLSEYPEVPAIASRSLGNIKRANKRARVLRCDPAYSDTPYGLTSWERGW